MCVTPNVWVLRANNASTCDQRSAERLKLHASLTSALA